jgi:predicted GNAT superfamily acetyltransferase
MASTLRSDADRATLDVRPIASLDEYRACVKLQAEVWGDGFESVPSNLLQVATYVGGLCLGAFRPDGEMCGLVFGLSGFQDGTPMHWSHLLAVRESARNLGVGRLLKERQRALLAARGIPEMRWSFDPMIAKNAHLNLNRLGARVVRYVPNMYGITDSPLHHGLATDRLVVAWATSPDAPVAPPMNPAPAPVLSAEPQLHDDVLEPGDERPGVVWLEVPSDFHHILAVSARAAKAWHDAVRAHFLWGLGNGYTVTGFHRDPVTSRSFYVLERR